MPTIGKIPTEKCPYSVRRNVRLPSGTVGDCSNGRIALIPTTTASVTCQINDINTSREVLFWVCSSQALLDATGVTQRALSCCCNADDDDDDGNDGKIIACLTQKTECLAYRPNKNKNINSQNPNLATLDLLKLLVTLSSV